MTDEQKQINEQFHRACAQGNLKEVKRLLTSDELGLKANIHYIHEGHNGLTLATMDGHFDVIRYLLESPELEEHAKLCVSDIPSINGVGESALLLACAFGHFDIVKYFLTSETLEVHSSIHEENHYLHYTALHYACMGGSLEIFRYLLDFHHTHTTSALQLDVVNRDGETLLMSAISSDSFEIIDYLLSEKEIKEHFNLFQEDNSGCSAFEYACRRQSYDMVFFLISKNYLVMDEKALLWLQKNQYHDIIQAIETHQLYHHLDDKLEAQKHMKKHKI